MVHLYSVDHGCIRNRPLPSASPPTATATEQKGSRLRASTGITAAPRRSARIAARMQQQQQEGKQQYKESGWKLLKRIETRDTGWSIVDVDFSADGR